MANAIAYYHWPGVWVGEQPASDPHNKGCLLRDSLQDEVFQADIHGISLHVWREGRFVFDFARRSDYAEPQDRDAVQFAQRAELEIKRTELLNSHVLCLHRAILGELRLSLPKVLVSPSTFITHSGEALREYGVHGHSLLSRVLFVEYAPFASDERFFTRPTISIKTIEASAKMLDALLSHDRANILSLTDLYLRACAFFEAYDFNLALIAAWGVTEALLDTMWDRYLRERGGTAHPELRPRISSRRRKQLTGRDYTASIITESLSLVGELQDDLYEKLNCVRSDRNNFIHELTPISLESASRSLMVAEEMLLLVERVDLALPHGLMLGG